MRRILLAVLAMALIAGCVAQGSDQGSNLPPEDNHTPEPPPVTYGNIANVEIRNYAFIPNEVTIEVGDTVVWMNNDNAQHTVTSDITGMFDSGLISKGISWNYTFSTAGTYTYHCRDHSYMTGTVFVV